MSTELLRNEERRQATIRRASIEDLDEIVAIWYDGQLSQGNEPLKREEVKGIFRQRLESQTDVYGTWVAEINGSIVGWQSLNPCRANPVHKWAQSSTYIAKKMMGRGIGRKLLSFATEHAGTVGLTHMEEFIKKGNVAPAKIVESLGWQKVGSIPRLIPSDDEWFYYVYLVPHRTNVAENVQRNAPKTQVKLDSHPQNRYHQLTRNKGGRNKLDDIRPLCPKHHEAMISPPDTSQSELNRLEIIEKHGCACPVDGCSQMYSLSLGYFETGLNDDYWRTTRSPSLSVVRNGTQAICGEHESAMFIESFDRVNKLERFRCPHNGCKQTMNIPSGGPPTYWLGSGYFRTSK